MIKIYRNIFKNFFYIKKKIFFFLFFSATSLIFISCSKKEDATTKAINQYINEGKPIYFYKETKTLDKEIYKIKSIDNYKKKQNYNLNSWSQTNYNSKNLIPKTNIFLSKKKGYKSISEKNLNLINIDKYVISIDAKANLTVYDQDLKKIKSIKIYKKKIYKNYNLNFSLGSYKNNIILADNLGNIFSYNIKNLSKNWEKKLGVPFFSSLKIYKDKIYIFNSNSKLYSFDAEDGKINWSFVTSSGIVKKKSSYQIAISENKLIFINDFAEIYCLDLQKKNILWSITLNSSSQKQTGHPFTSSPITVKNNHLFLSTNYGFTHSIDINTGRIIWTLEVFSESPLIFDDNFLFFVTKRNFLIVNYKNGEILFNKNYRKSRASFNKILLGLKHIYIFDRNGNILSINNSNLSQVEIIKYSNSFKDYIIFKKNLLLITNNEILKI